MSDHNNGATVGLVVDNVLSIKSKGTIKEIYERQYSISDIVHAAIPREWFDIHILGDENFDLGQSHIMLERIAGPAVGSFHIWRHQGYIHIRTLNEPGVDTNQAVWPERFRHFADAVEAISRSIGAQLVAWTLLLRANQDQGRYR